MPRRDDLLLVELGEILRLSDGPAATLRAVASALALHHDELVRVGFANVDASRETATVQSRHTKLPKIERLVFAREDRDVLCTGRVVANRDSDTYRAIGLGAYLIVPLLRDKVLTAIMFAGTDAPHDWTTAEIALYGEIAERTWLWCERERLVRELQSAKSELEHRVAVRTAALDRSLREKTILLKEIHHRVKNNLQVVSSLLSLQRDRVADSHARKALEDSQMRVRAMAIVHEKLYRTGDLASVLFSDYVRQLVQHLWSSMGAADRGIAANLEMVDLGMPIDQAIPCGLIVNELVTNALKHAFPEGRGTVTISLAQDDYDRCVLAVSDDGVGMPLDFSLERLHSFGLDMVLTFAEQLGAHIELSRDGGTTFRLHFQLARA